MGCSVYRSHTRIHGALTPHTKNIIQKKHTHVIYHVYIIIVCCVVIKGLTLCAPRKGTAEAYTTYTCNVTYGKTHHVHAFSEKYYTLNVRAVPGCNNSQAVNVCYTCNRTYIHKTMEVTLNITTRQFNDY